MWYSNELVYNIRDLLAGEFLKGGKFASFIMTKGSRLLTLDLAGGCAPRPRYGLALCARPLCSVPLNKRLPLHHYIPLQSGCWLQFQAVT